jgi:hypothetical protein
MKQDTRSQRSRRLGQGILVVLALAAGTPLLAQRAHLVASARESLGWWQLNPHMGHLWGSTCPADPGWRPGEGVTPEGAGALVKALRRRIGYGTTTLDSIVPLYPRRGVRPLCNEAVTADITAEDLQNFRGVRGVLRVAMRQMYTGTKMRDDFAMKLLQVDAYPTADFRIDSLTNVQRMRGDTVLANAVGAFKWHGVETPKTIPIKVWNEKSGMRVIGQLQMPARDMVEVYKISKVALGLGIGTDIWKLLHLGVDVVLQQADAAQHGAQP